MFVKLFCIDYVSCFMIKKLVNICSLLFLAIFLFSSIGILISKHSCKESGNISFRINEIQENCCETSECHTKKSTVNNFSNSPCCSTNNYFLKGITEFVFHEKKHLPIVISFELNYQNILVTPVVLFIDKKYDNYDVKIPPPQIICLKQEFLI